MPGQRGLPPNWLWAPLPDLAKKFWRCFQTPSLDALKTKPCQQRPTPLPRGQTWFPRDCVTVRAAWLGTRAAGAARRHPEQTSRRGCRGRKQTRRLTSGWRACGPGAPGAGGVSAERPALPTGASEAAGRSCIGGPGPGRTPPAGEAPSRREQASCQRNPSAGPWGPPAASEARRVSTHARPCVAAHGVTSRWPPLLPVGSPGRTFSPGPRGLSAVASSPDVPCCSPSAPSSAHTQGTWESMALGPCMLRLGFCPLFSTGRSG